MASRGTAFCRRMFRRALRGLPGVSFREGACWLLTPATRGGDTPAHLRAGPRGWPAACRPTPGAWWPGAGPARGRPPPSCGTGTVWLWCCAPAAATVSRPRPPRGSRPEGSPGRVCPCAGTPVPAARGEGPLKGPSFCTESRLYSWGPPEVRSSPRAEGRGAPASKQVHARPGLHCWSADGPWGRQPSTPVLQAAPAPGHRAAGAGAHTGGAAPQWGEGPSSEGGAAAAGEQHPAGQAQG